MMTWYDEWYAGWYITTTLYYNNNMVLWYDIMV